VINRKKISLKKMLKTYDLERIRGFKPFNICMLGMRRSGKSYAAAKLTKHLASEFDLCLSFLGTKNCNSELCDFIGTRYDPRLNFVEFQPIILKRLLKQQEDLLESGKKRHVLIIFDDVFANSHPNNIELLNRLFLRGRHFQISIINSAISFVTIAKNCRRSLDILFLYSSVCKSDNQILASEYVHGNYSTALYAIQNLEKYKALIIETKRNQKLFEYKFNESSGSRRRQVRDVEKDHTQIENSLEKSGIVSDNPETDTLVEDEKCSTPELSHTRIQTSVPPASVS